MRDRNLELIIKLLNIARRPILKCLATSNRTKLNFFQPHLIRGQFTFAEQHQKLNQLTNHADARGNRFYAEPILLFLSKLLDILEHHRVQRSCPTYSQYLQFLFNFLSKHQLVLKRVWPSTRSTTDDRDDRFEKNESAVFHLKLSN